MNAVEIGALLVGWWITGFLSSRYWWKKDYEVSLSSNILLAWSGLLGPIAWPMGWFLHACRNPEAISKPKARSYATRDSRRTDVADSKAILGALDTP